MDETNKAVENEVETETTQVDSPTTESPITGGETEVRVSNDQNTVTETPDIESTMTEEQRRAFQEMRLENKRLKEVREQKPENSAFDSMRVQTPPVGQLSPVRIENFQDTVTGETDWTAYNLAQQEREQRIFEKARYEASQELDERLDEREARTKYPELMNDPKTEKQIAAQWLWEKTQGNNVSVTQIAGEFARNFKQAVSAAEKISTEKVLNEVSEKEQATVTANQTRSANKASLSEDERQSLSLRTRTGDDSAVVARLSAIPWANK
jgi:hypothetical protein